ncbi:FliM/FliN family flagellar motor switch protein [Pectobacterium brasiliense]|uniref:FliM/FliN family flagellar motor switch protein n=1 Tax=Pectobacterium brasiliense TaxID=180957 RepID=UPI0019693C5F|nr:FliM/FliN family flagellar motor switch protein [Pectobacterium brasiliense]MBN3264709.1 FliM/FliN family flagellar motor switch protein [Pectobacterium brasiliense]
MSLRSHLRVKSLGQTELEQHCGRFAGGEIITTQPSCRYLYVLLHNEQGGEAEAFLDVDLWLREMKACLPGIPWVQVPVDYLVQWLDTMQLAFMLEETVWYVHYLTLPTPPLPEKLLSLPTQPSPLLCLTWPSGYAAGDMEPLWLKALPFTLQYVLGHSCLPLSALMDVTAGDLLLINNYSPVLTIGGERLFSFSYQNQEVIVEEQLNEFPEDYCDEEEVMFDWSNIPVNIEFVLDSHSMVLAELEDIRIGSSLPLSADAEKKVRIYLNRKYFAHGELVALENGTLAVEIYQLGNFSGGETSLSDA